VSAEDFTLGELAAGIAAGERSSAEIAEHYLERIEEQNDDLRAFCQVEPAEVRAAAARADKEIASEGVRGPLHGIPIAVKDLIFVAGLPITGGSLLYEGFVAEEDDACVARLREAGAVILGKTNTAEFGFSANQTANRVGGETRNPWDLGRSPGGSSGGSAAAVAGGLAPAAVGSDGGGSVRIPASFCGVAGLKPTFGRIPMYPGCRDPRWPGLSGWESVEHIGPICQTVQDAALMLDAMAGSDGRDRFSLPSPADRYADLLRDGDARLDGLRVAWSPDWGGQVTVDREVREVVTKAVNELAERGAAVHEAYPDVSGGLDAFGVTVSMDADPPAMRQMMNGKADLVDQRIVQIVGEDKSFTDILAAQRTRREVYLKIADFLGGYDVFVTPTVPVTALELGVNGPAEIDGRAIDASERPRAIIGFTYLFNLTGHPAMSVPCGSAGGLPVGMQIAAARLREDLVLRVGRAVETSHPPMLARQLL
jgi:aspartyl-tRNA(Asn)/glutamyl-tRNA(Gln) amidotransferase subunit A